MNDSTLENYVYPVVDEIKQSLPAETEFPQSPSTLLFGTGAVLDSINLVNFILAVEERIELLSGQQIRLVTENALSRSKSPFRTLATIAAYIDELMDKQTQ